MSVKCIFLISGETCIKTFTGKCCALPFVFRGAAVNRCLIDPKTNRSWCAVTPNFDTEKRWGYCQGSGEHTNLTWQSSALINCVPGHKCIAILPTHIALLSSIRFFSYWRKHNNSVVLNFCLHKISAQSAVSKLNLFFCEIFVIGWLLLWNDNRNGQKLKMLWSQEWYNLITFGKRRAERSSPSESLQILPQAVANLVNNTFFSQEFIPLTCSPTTRLHCPIPHTIAVCFSLTKENICFSFVYLQVLISRKSRQSCEASYQALHISLRRFQVNVQRPVHEYAWAGVHSIVVSELCKGKPQENTENWKFLPHT